MSVSLTDNPMLLAFAEAEAAAVRGEVPVGAVVVRDGVVLARAGNRTEELCDASAHAELLAMRQAGRVLGSSRLVGCDLYVTLEPCALCAAAIAGFRLRRLYFAAYDPKGGAVDHGPRLLAAGVLTHQPEIYGGLHEQRASALLKGFFKELRKG